MRFKKDDVVIVKDNTWGFWQRRDMSGLEGVVTGVHADTCNVRFPAGTLRGTRGEPTLVVNPRLLVLKSLYPHYKTGMAKLTKEERQALGV